jgi:ribosomal protein S18 acetylase RimI-like enzyme
LQSAQCDAKGDSTLEVRICPYGATQEEDDEIVSLFASAYVDEGYSKIKRNDVTPAIFQGRGEIVLAKGKNDELVGTVIFVSPSSPARQVADAGEAEIHLLAVKRSARKMGVASKLILKCFEMARAKSYPKMVLSTQPTMKAAQALYEKLGFTRNPKRDWSRNSIEFLVYEKVL